MLNLTAKFACADLRPHVPSVRVCESCPVTHDAATSESDVVQSSLCFMSYRVYTSYMYMVCCAVIGLCTSWGQDAPSVHSVPQGCSPSDADIMINIKAGFSRLGT